MRFTSLILLGLLANIDSTQAASIDSDNPSLSLKGGVQSGPSAGSSYAGGMWYDAAANRVYVVGSTYDAQFGDPESSSAATAQSSCFVAAVGIDSDVPSDIDYYWDDATVLGSPSVLETCQSLHFVAPSTLVVVGNSEPDGIHEGSAGSKMSGFAMAVDPAGLIGGEAQEIVTSVAARIPFPQFIVTNSEEKEIYMVSLTSSDDELSSSYNSAISSSSYPNWIQNIKYGTSLDMTVTKLKLTQEEFLGLPDGDAILSKDWSKEFPIDPDLLKNNETPRVYIGGMIYKQAVADSGLDNYLIVAGSTRGLGNGYGSAEGDDEDGFVSLLDTASGELISSRKSNERYGSAEDDVVSGICDDPNDATSFYIVGTTKGNLVEGDTTHPVDGSLQAWVKKIDVETLHDLWTKQFGAESTNSQSITTTSYALGCTVAPNGVVYIAGVVESNAGMIPGGSDMNPKQSFGGDDVWVAQLNALSGDLNWMAQVGTPGDDHLARHGGIAADPQGNVFLYGDTTGNFYRERSGDTGESGRTDIFVVQLDSQGTAPVASPTNAPQAAPVQAPTLPPVNPVPAPTLAPHSYQEVATQMEGPLYAGGLVYDAKYNVARVTGATYGNLNSDGASSTLTQSQCFVTTLDMQTGIRLDTKILGKTSTPEACSAISVSVGEDMTYIVGGTEGPDGFFVDNADPDDENVDVVQYGLMLQLYNDGDAQLVGGGVNQEDNVQYPIAVVTAPSEDFIYVVNMASDDSSQTNTNNDEWPNWTSGGQRKFGSEYYISVQRYGVTIPDGVENIGDTDVKSTLNRDWYQYFDTDIGAAYVSGMTLAGNGNTLVVVGSTKDSGGVFGSNSGTDMDGFILKLDPATGELLTAGGERGATRLDSANQQDDWINSVCNDRFDNDAFYVVGATMGEVRDLPADQQPPEGTIHAFVAKVKVSSLSAEWIKHFTMQSGASASNPPTASAFGCSVTPHNDGNLVYIAGVVDDGAVLDNADIQTSNGGDDIFVVQMDGGDGTIQWIKQIGTDGDERLAHGGGIDVDVDGNAIVFAETTGDMYTTRPSYATADSRDTVVFTMNKNDGSYKTPLHHGGTAPVAPPGTPPTSAPAVGSTPTGPTEHYSVLPDNIVALQTGPDVGPTYAGGMVYDRFTNAVYVTGATYGSFSGPGIRAQEQSSCFFASIILPKLQWNDRETFGTSTVPEACNALSLASSGSSTAAIVVGSTEEDGLLTQLGKGDSAKQYGFAMDLASVSGKYELQGGALLDGGNVQFPVGVVTDEAGHVWIVSMVSKDTKVTPDFEKVVKKEYPNLTTGGIAKYGDKYAIVVERHTMQRSNSPDTDKVIEETLKLDWRKPFETTDLQSVFVSGVIMVGAGNDLIVVGSTRGRPNSDDMDGLMAKIDPDDGTFKSTGTGSRTVAYFASVTGRDDWILNACPDRNDPLAFYIVGATQGTMRGTDNRDNKDVTVHAVVAKIHVNTLTAVWTKQFSVTHAFGRDDIPAAAAAYGCDVIAGDRLMYVVGNVENGATIDYTEPQSSAGRDDIFVTLMSTDDGSVKWMKQIGSNGDDRIAHGGGVKTDVNGNAVVFGDTSGSFYRSKAIDPNPDFTDVFVLIVDQKDGGHLPPLKEKVIPNTSTPEEWYPDYTKNANAKSVSFGIIAILLLILACGIYCVTRNRQRKRTETQKSSIFAYLQRFDVEDIDLRKSPPGGWHGTYLNKLAYGINKEDGLGMIPDVGVPIGYETAPLTHSSIVSDSLFMDTTSAPSLGYRDHPGSVGLDSYDDLTPRSYADQKDNLEGKEVI